MLLDSFFTQQIIGKAGNASGTVPVQSAVSPAQGNQAQIAFFELLAAQIGQTGNANTAPPPSSVIQKPTSEKLALSSQPKNFLLDKSSTLHIDIAQILAASPEIEAQAGEITALLGDNPTQGEVLDAIGQVLALNQQAFDAIIKPLVTDKITAEQSLYETGSASIYDAAFSGGSGFFTGNQSTDQSLTDALNLTQISQIAQALEQSGLDLQDDSQGVAVITLLQSIFPDLLKGQTLANGSKPVAVPLPAGGEVAANSSASDPVEMALAKQLNALTPGDALADVDASDFEQIFQRIQNAVIGGKAGKDIGANIKTNLKAGNAQNGHVLATLPSLQASSPLLGGLSADRFGGAEGLFGLSASGAAIQGAQGLGGSITQSYSAGQMHPASQMVALTMQKVGMNGTDKSITLQLDPPELGRVDVKMTFGKDKTVKALLSIEKPETFSMLQRDTHALEKAMQDIGLDADGGVDLELAQDNHNFDQDGRHDGSRNHARGFGNGDTQDTELLIMPPHALYLDPETGLVRCDFLA